MRPGQDLDDVQTATIFALRSVARRYQALSQEIAELDAKLDRLVADVAPELISLPAIGTDHAATLLLSVGDNPGPPPAPCACSALGAGVWIGVPAATSRAAPRRASPSRRL